MKRLYKLLVVLLLVVTVVGLTGCKKNNKVSVAGKYKMIEMVQGESKINKDMMNTIGVEYYIELKDDNTFELSMQNAGTFTGTFDDNKIYYKDKDDDGKEIDVERNLKIEDNKLSLSNESVTMVFEKE